MSIAFIACVESGNLENQAKLLFRSIRKYAGKYRDSAIYSYQPRKGPALKDETLAVFDELGVKHITKILNTDFHDYPIGNKIFTCAHAEKTLEEDALVFLDTDTVILNEPSDLDLPKDVAAAARPVDKKRLGSQGPDDKKDAYWQKIYKACGVSEPKYVTTTIDKKSIRAYWNAGLIAFRRDEGLMDEWKRCFLTIYEQNLIPRKSIARQAFEKTTGALGLKDGAADGRILNNLDQIALAAALAPVSDRVRVLDHRYNYPLGKRPYIPLPEGEATLEELVQIHYHRWFNRPDFLRLITPHLDTESERFKWIEASLPFEPTIDETPHGLK
ncbi:MAG: hypothetical protein KAR83_06790 [Thermodesulfovibrionales bacterium]|nr:hypothetical protein [Thermodesulfovibrionales bacterium]